METLEDKDTGDPAHALLGAQSASHSSNVTRSNSVSTAASSLANLMVNDEDDPENFPDPNLPYHQVVTTEEHGTGIIAARRIPAGTLIISEPPLLVIPESLEKDPSAISDAVKTLPKYFRKNFFALFNAKPPHIELATGIYNSNCYDIRVFAPTTGGSCVGATSSRLNHSCIPNVCFSYTLPDQLISGQLSHLNEEDLEEARSKGLIEFRAIRSISKGKELLSNYEKHIFASRKLRMQRLKQGYGFDCMCEACAPQSSFWEKSDERRKMMAELVKKGARIEKEWEARRDLDMCVKAKEVLVELETLLVKEGLMYTPLTNCYKSLAKWAGRVGEEVGRRQWLRKELEVVERCFGRGSERAKRLRAELETE